jgi:GH15 family glucan-1,4-alpha-glucosidase
MSEPAANPSHIEDYAMIGDLGTAALVSRGGSIDWLCWPRVDSDACMAALLGTSEHGRWQIAPKEKGARITRRYRPETLILETRFETDEGAATLIDFMPPRSGNSHIIRILKGERGSLTFRTELVVRYGYGAIVPWVTRIDPQTLRIVAGPDMMVLRTQVKMRGENLKTVGEVTIEAGNEVPFVLSYGASHRPLPEECDVQECLAATQAFWRDWAQRNKIDGPHKEAVTRSLITLKALTYAPTGGMVAAPTTSLPECVGGERNWDYRFCWLRDATLTLLALMNAGYYDEAHKWRDWLLRAAAGTPQQIQIMYGLRGERRLTEWEVPWLPGYANSKPVRIGNAAHNQRQIDVFGEVMDALHQARAGGLGTNEAGWDLQQEILKHVERVWPRRDEGIWEVRSGREHFTYSKAMAWVAFDRAIKSAEMYKLPGPLAHWRRVRDEIHSDVCTRGFDPEMNSFVRAYGSKELDASLLLLPAIGFLPPDDPRIVGTVAAIERDLVTDGLVRRYDTAISEDGLQGGEGMFIACSFWLADAYLMLGRRKDAEALFDKLLALRNDVGLLSEEYAPASQRLVGNFPQAFSHLALVNCASNLAHGEKPAEQRAEVKVNGKEKSKVS